MTPAITPAHPVMGWAIADGGVYEMDLRAFVDRQKRRAADVATLEVGLEALSTRYGGEVDD